MTTPDKGPFHALLALTEVASARLEEEFRHHKACDDGTRSGRVVPSTLARLHHSVGADIGKLTPSHFSGTQTSVTDTKQGARFASITQTNHSKERSGGTEPSFTMNLMKLLLMEQQLDVIRFLPDAKHFAILNIKKFYLEILPIHFGVRGYGSFSQKLLRWGFECLRERVAGVRCAIDIFYHPNFERGNWEKCRKLKCLGALEKRPIRKDPVPRGVFANSERSLLSIYTTGLDVGGRTANQSKTTTEKYAESPQRRPTKTISWAPTRQKVAKHYKVVSQQGASLKQIEYSVQLHQRLKQQQEQDALLYFRDEWERIYRRDPPTW